MVGLRQLLTRKLWKDSAYMTVSSFLLSASGLLTTVVLSRYLSPQQYGLIGLAMTTVLFVKQFLDLHFEETLVKFALDYLGRGRLGQARQLFRLSVLLSGLLGGILVLLVWPCAGILSHLFQDQPATVEGLIRLYVWAMPCAAFDGCLSGVLSTYKDFKALAVSQSTSAVLRLALPVLGVPYGLKGVMAGFVLAQWSTTGLLFLFSLRLRYQRWGTVAPESIGADLPALARFTWHTALSSSCKSLWQYVDVLLIGMFRPASEVSFYKIARSGATLLMTLSAPLRTTIYPELCEAWTRGERGRYICLLKRVSQAMAIVTLPLCGVIYFAADPLVQWLYPEAYGGIAEAFRILVFGTAAAMITAWARPFALSSRRVEISTYLNLYISACLVCGGVLVTPRWGYIGAAYVFAVAFATVAVLWSLVAQHVVRTLGSGEWE